jgi:hypothetical protein
MSSSIFGKDPSKQPAPHPFARERIEKEIAHLQNPQSTRRGPNERMTQGISFSCVILLAVAGLYLMDPFLYAWYKGDAIQAYLYLHNCDSEQKAQAIVATGILTEGDVDILNHRNGSFQDYYSSPQDAERAADTIISFMNGLSKLHTGAYDNLDTLGKIRYNLFCRWGLIPPSEWAMLNPAIKDK